MPPTLLLCLAALSGCASRPAGDFSASLPRSHAPSPAGELQCRTFWGRELCAYAAGAKPALEADLAKAAVAHAAQPADPDAIVWHGRRLGYLWRMRDAIGVYSRGLKRYPGSAELLRHRGHRRISIREFDTAIADLRRAAELVRGKPDVIEPDGMPNEKGIPLTTLGFNIWYHLALAQFLERDFDDALDSWRTCAGYSRDLDDNRVAVAYWTYLTLRNLGRAAEASRELELIHAGMSIIENRAYYELLMLFKGQRDADALLASVPPEKSDFAAIGYGIGAWHALEGRRDRAIVIWTHVVSGENWPAFGFIAAEMALRVEVDD